MTSLAAAVGCVDFDGVWVDDRRRCAWGLCDASFVIEPGSTVALVVPDDEGAAETVLDLLSGRRLPVRGRVTVDGVDLRDFDPVSRLRSLTAEFALDTGEHRLTVANRTTLISRPEPASVERADAVIAFDRGFVTSVGAPERERDVTEQRVGAA